MTKIIGILNYTPNSFSDGGHFYTIDKAMRQARKMFLEGADIVDIGGMATSYGAKILSHEHEWQRLAPLLQQCASDKYSLDTCFYQTAEKGIAEGIGWINDTSGARDKRMLEVIASHSDVKYTCMYSLVLPADRDTKAKSFDDILQWGSKKIEEALSFGIKKERFIFDPGIGFATDAALSFEIIKRCQELKELGVKICIGHSRKSFFNTICSYSPEERDIETVAASSYMFLHKIDYLRVHNVSAHIRSFKTIAMFL